jgi:hypothetical protein
MAMTLFGDGEFLVPDPDALFGAMPGAPAAGNRHGGAAGGANGGFGNNNATTGDLGGDLERLPANPHTIGNMFEFDIHTDPSQMGAGDALWD